MSSSPSGCHITQYKILAADPELSQVLAKTITMSCTHSISPVHWRAALQFMLRKEPGNITISKLRVIQQLEVDINFAFYLLWCKLLVNHALSHNALSTWNFGGRPGARVHSALLLKTNSYYVLHFTCHNAIIFDKNAKACSDRTIPSLSLMAIDCLGMPQSAMASMLATIKGMHFFICTGHSIFPGFYTSTAAALILVLHQSTKAPTESKSWVLNSSKFRLLLVPWDWVSKRLSKTSYFWQTNSKKEQALPIFPRLLQFVSLKNSDSTEICSNLGNTCSRESFETIALNWSLVIDWW